MACYLPDHLVRCAICKRFFSDARRLRCGCVYCYHCCLTLVHDLTLQCHCLVKHRFKSSDDFEKALVVDNVVNDLVRQRLKKDQTSILLDDERSLVKSSIEKRSLAVAQPPCSLCHTKSHAILFCDHCQSDICELCLEKHYDNLTDVLQKKWIECQKKFHQINDHVSLSQQNKIQAMNKLDHIRNTIDERTKTIKNLVENHRQTLARHIDHQIEKLEELMKNNTIDNEYQSMRERLPKIIREEQNTSNLVAFLEKTDEFLQQLAMRDEQVKEIETKVPSLSTPDPFSINVRQLIGELRLDDQPLVVTRRSVANSPSPSEQRPIPSLVSFRCERGQYPRRMRSRPCRGFPQGFSRYNRYQGRGRVVSSSRSRMFSDRSTETNLQFVPNHHQSQWSIDFKEIPYFLSVLDNRHRAQQPETRPNHRHDYMLFICDDQGQLAIHSLPKSMSQMKPSLVGTGELFSKNHSLLLEAFTVYEFAIVVYVRRFEQRVNEMEHSKLIKAGLPIMTGEQGRCNDHGGMIYLFSHGGEEIDGVYQSHPIRVILADSNFARLWALNPMDNHVYCYMTPNNRDEIRKSFQEEEIFLDLADQSFEPSTLIQSSHSLGLIDTEHDVYRLYSKDDSTHLITTYQNLHQPQWKITGGVVFQDNRTLLKLTEDKYFNDSNEQTTQNRFSKIPRRRLIELSVDGEEKRQIQADALYGMTLGPNDEIILGFAVRGDRGLIHCY